MAGEKRLDFKGEREREWESQGETEELVGGDSDGQDEKDEHQSKCA
jgi:hypothetical protein